MNRNLKTNNRLRTIWLSFSPLLAVLFLFLNIAAVNPALHEKLHDAGASNDTCAVCALNHHQLVSVTTVDTVQAALPPQCRVFAFVFVSSFQSTSYSFDHQGRSPPSGA
ncbi:MAG: hypothetical protein JWN25_1995 [Verrucomicrobiales bacterium]|nr:hypothetical protein [Verrucomicrobiales bacterium]